MKQAVMCTVPGNRVQTTVGALRSAGISNQEISVLAPHVEGMRNTDLAPDVLHGAETGALVGGAVGELANLASLAIAGIGPFVAAGPVAVVFAGALGGTLVGGLTAATGELGRLVGIPHSVASHFEKQLAAGRGLVFVHYRGEEHKNRAVEVFKRFDATDIETTHEMEWRTRAERP